MSHVQSLDTDFSPCYTKAIITPSHALASTAVAELLPEVHVRSRFFRLKKVQFCHFQPYGPGSVSSTSSLLFTGILIQGLHRSPVYRHPVEPGHERDHLQPNQRHRRQRDGGHRLHPGEVLGWAVCAGLSVSCDLKLGEDLGLGSLLGARSCRII